MMYNLSKGGRWYNRLIKYSQLVLYCYSMLALIFLVGFWYIFMYRPIKQTILHYDEIIIVCMNSFISVSKIV